MSQTILIIGANSALAQAVISLLAAQHTIITAGRDGCDIYCDVAVDVQIPEGVSAVINFAAVFGTTTDVSIVEAYQANLLGSLRVCMAAHKVGVSHVIQISSLSAVLTVDSPYYNTYALTKRQADESASYYCAQVSLPLTILRPSQIYGNNPNFARHQPLFYDIIDKAANGQDVTIFGSHDARRNYIHSQDVSQIISLCLERTITGTYVCSYPSDVTYSELAQLAQGVFKKGGAIRFQEDKPDIPDNVFDNSGDIYHQIDYLPQISLETGIASIKAFREELTT